MKLIHHIEYGEKEIELIVTFECEDQGWGEGFSGTHGKESDLSYEIEMIECSNDYDFAMKLNQQLFYNEIREVLLNDDHFL